MIHSAHAVGEPPWPQNASNASWPPFSPPISRVTAGSWVPGMLVEFGSVVDALRCATEVQVGMDERNAEVPSDRRTDFRVGIHMGDVVVEDGDIFV
jgi:hypothetical protein